MRQTLDPEKADEIATSFHRLAEEWNSETAPLSSIRLKKEHPAYRQLVAMEEPAIPLILADLARKPSQLFWVLRDITNVSPADPGVAKDFLDVIKAWIEWGWPRGTRCDGGHRPALSETGGRRIRDHERSDPVIHQKQVAAYR
jgi:hypothetical protein